MYTCCPECETTFRVGVDDLRRAQGKVRCGDCEHVFNAAAYLTETNESEFAEELPTAETEPQVREASGFQLDTAPANDDIDDSHDDDSGDDAHTDIAATPEAVESWSPEDLATESDQDEEEDDSGVGILVTDEANESNSVYVRTAFSAADEDSNDAAKAGEDGAPGGDTETLPHLNTDASEENSEREELVLTDSEDGEPQYYTDRELDAREPAEASQDSSDSAETESAEPRYYSDDSGIDDDEPEAAAAARQEPRYYSDESGIDDDDDEEEESEEWIVEETLDAAADDEEWTVETTVEDDGADTQAATEQDADDDFDDTIWERIPGVGASTDGIDDDADNVDEPEPFIGADTVSTSDEDTDGDSGSGPRISLNEDGGITGADDLEFNVPEEKWSNFFGKIPEAPQTPDWSAIASGGSDDDAVSSDAAAIDAALENDGEQDEWSKIDASQWSEDEPADTVSAAEQPSPDSIQNEDQAPTFEYDSDEDLEDYATTPPWQPEVYAAAEAPEQPPSRSGRWFLLGVILLVGFTTQLIHYNRDALASHPSFGATVRDLYAGLGDEIFPAWPVSNYEIRGSEAVAGESGPDVLDIRTQIASVGDQATGLPQLRVVLRDRWSNPVAARHFGPEDYLAADDIPASGMMLPNDTLNAFVSIVDPGSGAQGFELQLCLPRRDTGLDCTGQPFQ